eukprot:597983-Amphidinium_carterae.1
MIDTHILVHKGCKALEGKQPYDAVGNDIPRTASYEHRDDLSKLHLSWSVIALCLSMPGVWGVYHTVLFLVYFERKRTLKLVGNSSQESTEQPGGVCPLENVPFSSTS